MDIEDYIKETNRQLSYISNYQKLNIGPTELHTKKTKTVTNNYKNAEQISSKNSFLSDKVKATDISSADCHASRISEFDYHYMQPAVTDRKSDVQDKTDFIER